MDTNTLKSLLNKISAKSATPAEEILACKILTTKAKELNALLENLLVEINRSKLSN